MIKVATAFRFPLDGPRAPSQDHNARWAEPNAYDKFYGVAYHIGEDIGRPIGTLIYNTANGVVTHAEWTEGYGNLVMVEHTLPNGQGIVTSIYGHLDEMYVEKGNEVDINVKLGTTGNGGTSDGPHLHFAIYLGSFNGTVPRGASPALAGGGYPGIDNDTVYSGFVDPSSFIARFGTSHPTGGSLAGTTSNDHLFGDEGNDFLSGREGDDFLHGGSGDDNLDGSLGRDVLIGSGGADKYHIGIWRGYENNDTVDDQGGSGKDIIYIYGAGQVISASQIVIEKHDDYDAIVSVYNSSGTILLMSFNIFDMARLGGQIEEIHVLGANEDQSRPLFVIPDLPDRYWSAGRVAGTPPSPGVGRGGGEAPDPEASTSGKINWWGTSGGDGFIGTDQVDIGAGLGGADTLSGGIGDDILLGNAGADELSGGSGDDLLVDDDQGVWFADHLSGGTGDDTLVFRGAPSGLTDTGDGGSGLDLAYIDLSDRTRDWRLTDNDGDIWIRLASGSTQGDIELENFEAIAVLFGSGDDFAHSGNQQAYFEGNGGNDQLISEGRNDYLDGGAGDDKLDAGTGVDWIDGGSGNDRAEVDLSNESRDLTYVADQAEDDDGFTFENGTHIRDIERIELVTGSGDDRIWLGDDDDDVDTRGGDDVIFTDLEAHDSVDGGSGRDRLVVDRSDSDERLRSSYDSSDNDFEISREDQYATAEHRLHASSIEELVLLGGSANDTLRGGSGDDELIGNGGDDFIRGGDGADRMEGGSGDDDLHIDEGADWVDGGPGDDWGDLDKSDSNVSFTVDTRFAASSSGTTLQDGTHIRNVERLDIDLGSGNDTVITTVHTDSNIDLGGGDNRIVIDHRGQTSSLIAGPGLRINLPSYLISLDLAFDAASNRIWVRGADQVSIYGGNGNDQIAGLNGTDVLDGGAGDDLLSGGLGQNFLTGGAGNDSLFVSNSSDVITELQGEGIDRIYASVNYTLAPGVYVETLSTADDAGTDPLTLAGNELDNRIIGNAGANLIYGLGGSDYLAGVAGDDRYVVDLASDLVVEAAGQGYDTVFSPVSYALAATSEVEALLTLDRFGTQAIDFTGNEFNNVLYGNAAANRLSGGGGDDRLEGGDGGDQLDGGVGFDGASYAGAGATVTVSLALLGVAQDTGAAGIDTLIDIEGLVGSAFADTLIGNASDNILNGFTGGDWMEGGAGDDVYFVDNAGDTVVERAGEGIDEVRTVFAAASLLGSHVENLTASTDVAHDFRGSAGDNAIRGGAGSDFLRLYDGGNDSAYGGSGNDVILFGASMSWTDFVDGGDGLDQLVLQGQYVDGSALLFGGGVVSIENIAILPGNDTRFGDSGTSFYDYKLTLQNATVAAGVQLVVDANRLRSGEDLWFDGSAELDGSFFIYGGGGTDILFGGAQNDVFLFGAQGQWNPGDVVVGGSGIDQLALRGNYALTFGAGQLFGVENIGLLSAHDTRFGALGSSYSYDLNMVDGNVASGVQMTVDGAKLRVAEFFRFDGSAETDGSFRLFGGLVGDTLIGSRNGDLIQGNGGADALTGGEGADIFRYLSTSDSTTGAADRILDFTPGTDKIDLSRIDANTHSAGDQAFSWIGPNAFTGSGAASAGQLRAFQSGQSWFVQGDTDGDGSADFVVELTLAGPTPLGTVDFLL